MFLKLSFNPIMFSLLLFCLSCSSIDTIGPKVAGTLFYKASDSMQRESDLSLFSASMPANLKTLEGLLYLAPKSKEIVTGLIKGYFAYAFMVYENKYYLSTLKGLSKDKKVRAESSLEGDLAKREAIKYYERAISYGFYYLSLFNLTSNDLKELKGEGVIKAKLKESFDLSSKRDSEALFFLGQSWFATINLQRDRPEMIGEIPFAKEVIDSVCEVNPNFLYGGCNLFYAIYESSRPAIFGGHPEKGDDLFKQVEKDFPSNLFARVAYLQFRVIPSENRDEFNRVKGSLDPLFKKWDEELLFKKESLPLVLKEGEGSDLNLMNSMANERFIEMKKSERLIFE